MTPCTFQRSCIPLEVSEFGSQVFQLGWPHAPTGRLQRASLDACLGSAGFRTGLFHRACAWTLFATVNQVQPTSETTCNEHGKFQSSETTSFWLLAAYSLPGGPRCAKPHTMSHTRRTAHDTHRHRRSTRHYTDTLAQIPCTNR